MSRGHRVVSCWTRDGEVAVKRRVSSSQSTDPVICLADDLLARLTSPLAVQQHWIDTINRTTIIYLSFALPGSFSHVPSLRKLSNKRHTRLRDI
ncbi:hypothetical protein MRB53_040006 [Persea americana]|nr:hypothetical protein MRB53_040006 [Persea americana]